MFQNTLFFKTSSIITIDFFSLVLGRKKIWQVWKGLLSEYFQYDWSSGLIISPPLISPPTYLMRTLSMVWSKLIFAFSNMSFGFLQYSGPLPIHFVPNWKSFLEIKRGKEYHSLWLRFITSYSFRPQSSKTVWLYWLSGQNRKCGSISSRPSDILISTAWGFSKNFMKHCVALSTTNPKQRRRKVCLKIILSFMTEIFESNFQTAGVQKVMIVHGRVNIGTYVIFLRAISLSNLNGYYHNEIQIPPFLTFELCISK